MARARRRAVAAVLASAALGLLAPVRGAAAAPDPGQQPSAALTACRLQGVPHGAWCGSVSRGLDPARPGGTRIDVHFAVLPAVARNKRPDPVFFFAGGPGQSAIDIAGSVSRLLGRFGNRRDVVLIDQRGTGRSAPLHCAGGGADSPPGGVAEVADITLLSVRLGNCRRQLQRLPHGDLRHYTTVQATQDADAVRRALGAVQINLVGVSYGTRAALDYMRQFPHAVRRVVLDGVAPPDMVLPAAFSTDLQAAIDALLHGCEVEAACRANHPALRTQWHALLASLPRQVVLPHPALQTADSLLLTRDMLLGLVRLPLYVPALAAGLPLALTAAAQGRFGPLVGLAAAVSGRQRPALAQGMHMSVLCAEDAPRLDAATDRPGADVGTGFAELYRKACADWPRGAVPAAFYTVPPAPAATLLLSGGLDPVTPPRHGERVARALGASARHVVIANAGHGVLGIGCMRDVVFRFVDAATDDAALHVQADCASAVPRPPAFAAAGGAR